jgi:hypothetical protein
MRHTSRRRPNKINLLRKDEKEKKIERERKRERGREREERQMIHETDKTMEGEGFVLYYE